MITSPTQPKEVRLTYSPLPKQAEFHGSDARFRFFGGGWGNGKTSAGCVEGFTLAMEYPGSMGLICRKTRPELKATTQHQFFHGGGGNPETDWTGVPEELIKKFNKSEGKLTLINGSIIHFWPLDDPDKLSNLNLGWFLIDQAEEVSEEMFEMLRGRLRQRNAPRKGICLFNPNGHDWIWKRVVFLKDTYKDHELVHAKTTDNPNLPKDYIDSLMNMPEQWRRRFIDGSFDVFSGQIFPEIDPDIHFINPFPIPEWYELYEGIDHGRRNPTAVLFAATDDLGNCFIIDEHYEAGRLVSHHAGKILEKREVHGSPEETVIDASAAQQDPNTGRSVIDEYYDHGIITVPSDRHVAARINRIAEWLRLDPDHPHPITGDIREDGYPRLYIFKNCVNLIEHLPQYRWKKQPVTQETDAKEQPLEKDDHDVDALGYILMRRPQPSAEPEENSETNWYWKRIRDRMDGKGSIRGHHELGVEA